MKLHETKHSLSFLSIDFPTTEDGHTLVIPKKHYKNVEDIPKTIMNDVAAHMQLVARAIKTKNSACNILLNDGKAADQTIWHAHFHLVPRNKGDGIVMEGWKRKKMSPKQFKTMYNEVRNAVDSVKTQS